MRIISGAILVFASAVSAAGYEIARAENVFRGGPLSFLAWVLGLSGIALMAIGWFDDFHQDNATDKEKRKQEKNKTLKQETK
jgi:hypothetical protein